MARARNIKPGFFTHDGVAELAPLTRLLFIGLWTVADRAGRLEDRPKRIKAEVLPYDECDMDAMLTELHEAGFILRYRVGDVAAIQIVKWDKHQNPHIKESESTIPAPCEHGADTVQAGKSAGMAEQPSTRAAGLIPDSGFPLPDSPIPVPDGTGSAVKPARRPPAIRKPDDVTERTWMDWQQLRRAKRAPVTETVIEGARREAGKAGLELEEFLKVWCRRGSQGLEAAWLKPEERGRAPPASEPAWRTEQRQRTQLAAPGVAAKDAPDFFLDAESRHVTSGRLGGQDIRQADPGLRPVLPAPVD